MNRKFLIIGLICWTAATLAIRFVGQFILTANNEYKTIFVALLLAVPLVLPMLWLYRRENLPDEARLRAAVSFAVPGMLLDALTTLFFSSVFPNMSPAVGKDFGALMLWGYAVIILTGIIRLSDKSPKNAALIILTGVTLLAPVYSQRSDEKAERRERERLRKKFSAYAPIAVYEGGFFGFNRRFQGIVERENMIEKELQMKTEKDGKIVFAIPYRTINALSVESGEQPPRWMQAAGNADPTGLTNPLKLVVRSKYHRLFVNYADAETGISGTAIFRFERLEAAAALLEQLAADLGLIKRENIYVRPKPPTATNNSGSPS